MARDKSTKPRSTLDINEVWMTFDDGPTSELTSPILDHLARYRVSATFFVRGAAALRNQDLVRRAAHEGHDVANHTMTHRDLTTLPTFEIERELTQASDLIERLVGVPPRYFRPPFGRYDGRVLEVANTLGLETILWSVSAEDWQCPGAETVVATTVDQARPGAIVLFHDGCGHLAIEEPVPHEMRAQIEVALPQILEALQSRSLLPFRGPDA